MSNVFADADRWVIASHNAGKIREIAELVAPFAIRVTGAGEAGLPEPEETEDTFEGNALLKARAAAAASGAVALADDSGLAVEALGGAPGIHSARWAGEERDFARAMEKVENALRAEGNTNRRARFVCALALVHPDGKEAVFTGTVEGTLVWPPRGEQGFGYDPIFVPDGHTQTFAEMDPEKKRAISHRADAFARLVAAVFAA
ncbi:RdgB/HAM1 family non-canonical purine NTP pyrophosphatase [Marinicauda algicola]|uniref:dITP/XTP pyrophosphatase n=1 Tax=Marinicauda algicola TaxID=2029849 RepID=A0A4S2H037_9PROT|nr:RdgB/HAM1 family non-canonical purine NTP pyrophosphatase [Marinicauda algicola]TGY88875.1 RdgB/HAM1 family non-canonical purine NTP pyrophosphatase [Marinicauda algicola]